MRILFACSLSSRNFQICHDWNGQPPQIGGEGLISSCRVFSRLSCRPRSKCSWWPSLLIIGRDLPTDGYVTTNMKRIGKRNVPLGEAQRSEPHKTDHEGQKSSYKATILIIGRDLTTTVPDNRHEIYRKA
jgi:hypothetical protein